MDILPTLGVTVVSLIEAIDKGSLRRTERGLINITGRGMERLKEEHRIKRIPIDLTVTPDSEDSVAAVLGAAKDKLLGG
jgi:hypothetical protein